MEQEAPGNSRRFFYMRNASLEVQATSGINQTGRCALLPPSAVGARGRRMNNMAKVSRSALALNRVGRLALGACALALVAAPLATGTASARGASRIAATQADEINAFYRARGGAPLWLSPGSGAAAQELVQLLAIEQADNLNPRR